MCATCTGNMESRRVHVRHILNNLCNLTGAKPFGRAFAPHTLLVNLHSPRYSTMRMYSTNCPTFVAGAVSLHAFRQYPSITRIDRKAVIIRQCAPKATLDDFLAGPEQPARPRPLSQVVAYSVCTGLLWYGWYKVGR